MAAIGPADGCAAIPHVSIIGAVFGFGLCDKARAGRCFSSVDRGRAPKIGCSRRASPVRRFPGGPTCRLAGLPMTLTLRDDARSVRQHGWLRTGRVR